MDTRHSPRGFIALITAVVISTILLGLATTMGTNTLFARFDALNGEFKRVSVGLAESCVNAALTKLSQDFNYSVLTDPLYNATRGGAVVAVGSNDCVIKPMTYTTANNKRTYTITTQGSYHGAFTNLSVTAVSQDPSAAPVVPPPLCTLIASPTSIPSGRNATLLWSNSSNAVTFTLDHSIGAVTPLSGGSVTITPVGIGPITYTGTTGNTGGTNTCTATITVTPPPPAPSCADSVMIFDRTGSMNSTDLSNERSAGNALIDLYAGVSSPSPLVGVGSFGAYPNASLPAGAASVSGQLSTAYATIKSTLASITGTNSSVGSDLSAAINVGATELNSVRHTSGKQKVLIFVSDGLPNQPSASTADTGFLSPTANVQNGTGDAWTNPANAYATAGGDASDVVSGAHRHRLYNFNFPTLPTGATVSGIETVIDAWATDSASPQTTGNLTPTATGLSTDWSANTGTVVSAVQTNDSSTSYIAPTPQQETYTVSNAGVPTGSTITSVTLHVVAQGTGSTIQLMEENGTNQVLDPTVRTLTSSYVDYTYTFPTSPTGGAWSSSEVNAWTTRFGVQNNTGATARVTQVYVVVGYTAPPATSCQVGVDLSWNGGTSWTTEKTQTVSGTQATYTLGSQSDDWSTTHTWVPADFTNTNFRARIHAIDPGTNCGNSAVDHVDWLRMRVTYSQPSDPTTLATAAANAAKAPGGVDGLPVTIFAIHFGSATGQPLMNSLATQNVTTASIVTATRSGSTVTITTSAPHGFVKGNQVVIAGVGNSALNGTYTITSTASATTFTYTTGSNGTVSSSGGTAKVNKNFFISPTSADMQAIFQAIGTAVCPAAAAQCANAIDDDGDGLVDSSDPGCHTDGNAANAASYDVSDNDEWEAVATPPVPPPPPPPPNVQLGSWTEVPTLP